MKKKIFLNGLLLVAFGHIGAVWGVETGSAEQINFDRLFPQSSLEHVVQSFAHVWSDIHYCSKHKYEPATCHGKEFCNRMTSQLMNLYRSLIQLEHATVAPEDLGYIRRLMNMTQEQILAIKTMPTVPCFDSMRSMSSHISGDLDALVRVSRMKKAQKSNA